VPEASPVSDRQVTKWVIELRGKVRVAEAGKEAVFLDEHNRALPEGDFQIVEIDLRIDSGSRGKLRDSDLARLSRLERLEQLSLAGQPKGRYIRFRDPEDGHVQATLSTDCWIPGLAVSPDGRLLAVAGANEALLLYEIGDSNGEQPVPL
jgi:hypothetical protein